MNAKDLTDELKWTITQHKKCHHFKKVCTEITWNDSAKIEKREKFYDHQLESINEIELF